ncbi:hypothetical protein ACE1SV_08680 [Streptomyces sennicomposti]
MDRGTESNAPRGRREGNVAVAGERAAGRVRPAVALVGRDRLVSHWSRSARELFGVPEEDAIGRPADDLLPVSGALPDEDDEPPDPGRLAHGGLGPAGAPSPGGRGAGPALSVDGSGSGTPLSPDGPLSQPAAGRARLAVPGRDRLDVLWWAYPLVGPGRARLLVLAADADGLRDGTPYGAARRHGAARGRRAVERIAPAFAPHTDFPGAGQLARGLPEALPGTSAGESARIVSQVLELGCPALEFSQDDRVPVTADWGVPAATGSAR